MGCGTMATGMTGTEGRAFGCPECDHDAPTADALVGHLITVHRLSAEGAIARAWDGRTMERLRALREDRLMTQAELAARCGLTTATVSRLEKGRHRARPSTVRRVAEALGVEPKTLVGRGEGKR